MNQELQKLIDKRKNWVQANRDNNFDEGISRLLTELYPDNAHFIYELLQNAEDPQATEVHFTLTPNSLRFEHNGKRLFTIKDLESITSIGNSTKRDDATSIGKFGVGFKAVFAYTDTPQIHSGEFNIEIRDLVCPSPIDKITSTYDTCFVFPFNNAKKPAMIAFNEIEKALLDLNENTVLFLSSIKKISYEIEEEGNNKKTGSIAFEKIDTCIAKITQKKSQENDSSTLWLKFEKNETIKNDQGATVSCTLAIAYSLKEKTNKTINKVDLTVDNKYEIVPLNQSHVFIYFPAIKETSNLKFHIHAPFASTVARDSVRDCEENKLLLNAIATLVSESLIKIYDLKLLNTAFLGVMPNGGDNLRGFYKPISQKINQTFHEKTILPMKNGGFMNAVNVYTGGKEFSDLINDDDLVFLTDDGNWAPMWVANPRPQHQREDNFIKNLGVQKWDVENLIDAINKFNDPDDHPDEKRMHFNRWIANKDDDWLARLYNLLGGYFKPPVNSRNIYHKYLNANKLKFIKINSTKVNENNFTYPTNAYIDVDNKSISTNDINIVKINFSFRQKGSDASFDYIKFLYHHLNINSFDFEASLKLKIQAMQNIETRFKRDDGSYYDFIKECMLYSEQSNSNIKIFEEKLLLLAAKPSGEFSWAHAENVFVDSIFEKTNLSKLSFLASKKLLLSDEYFNKGGFNNENNYSAKFINFLKKVGVQFYISIKELPIFQNHQFNSTDFTIEGIDFIIKNINIDYSLIIWKALQNFNNDFTRVKSKSGPGQKQPSTLVQILMREKWLPNAKGTFSKPSEISWDDLHPDLSNNIANPLQDYSNRYFSEFLKAVEFGEQTEQKIADQGNLSAAAKLCGFSSFQEARELQIFKEQYDSLTLEQKDFVRSLNNPSDSFPSSSTSNPAGRSERAEANAKNTQNKNYSQSNRSVNTSRTSEEKAASRQYLKTFYTDDARALRCQCCQHTMPFRLSRGIGEYYFVDVQITKSTKEHTNYRIALCPTCAAMYRHANDQTDEVIQAKLRDCELEQGAGNAAIDIKLAGRSMQLRFVTKHLIDVQAILKAGV